jgi:hypothetical protein
MFFSYSHPEREPGSDEGDGGSSAIWPKDLARECERTKTRPQTDDIPCVPLICPDEDVSAVSDPEVEGTPKRRRTTLVSHAKSAASIPAIVIPHCYTVQYCLQYNGRLRTRPVPIMDLLTRLDGQQTVEPYPSLDRRL